MLNEAERSWLCIATRLIQEKMRTIEYQLVRPEAHWLMSEVQNNITPAREQALRERIQVVDTVIDELRTKFALPAEATLASREILKGSSAVGDAAGVRG
jgi:hypothetical protein